VPTDRPDFRPERVDIEGAVRRALENRTDLDQARKQLQANDVAVNGLSNAVLPALDLGLNYGLSGLGGPQFVRSGLGGAISQTVPGGYNQALGNISNFDAPNWSVALNLSYPIGTSAADAGLARARLQVQQTQAQIRQLELNVATEVTNTALAVESNLKRVEAASAARELAQRRLEAEQSKFEVGMSTNYFVVQAQRDLRDAQNIELRTLLDYRKSLVDFERVQETSLARAGITIIGGTSTTNQAARVNAGGGGGGGGNFGGGQ
jgi:outer membrane protein TolC